MQFRKIWYKKHAMEPKRAAKRNLDGLKATENYNPMIIKDLQCQSDLKKSPFSGLFRKTYQHPRPILLDFLFGC